MDDNTTWTNAWNWFKSLDEYTQALIHKTALAHLQKDWPEGQGISSSDISCSIVTFYQSWILSTQNLTDFTLDYLNT